MNEAEIGDRRYAAALASGGASSDPIHALFDRTCDELELGGRLLDFGAGWGGLSVRLAAKGRFKVTAADIVSRPPDLPSDIAWCQGDLNDSLALAPHSFDIIVASEVIEHLENPRAVAREWFRLLSPGGWLLASTPNNESVRSIASLAARGHFVAFLDLSYPAHITALLRRDLARILLEAGFEAPSFRFTGSGVIPRLTRFRWQQLSSRLGGMRFSDNLMAVARAPS